MNLPEYDWQTLHGRQLAVYPDCANLKEIEMKSCCDKEVRSVAGREFCYDENIIYDAKEIVKCRDTDVVVVFKCCETLALGDKDFAYKCQSELTKSDCITTAVCIANYKTGLQKYLKYKQDLEALPSVVAPVPGTPSSAVAAVT